MPIGSGIVYNTGDLILSQVSSSGTAFLETKIAAATSSIVYFDSNARINSASLNNITVGTASNFAGYPISRFYPAYDINQSNDANTYYYLIGYIGDNNGSFYVKGLLGGHDLDSTPQGGSYIDLAIFSRYTQKPIVGTIYGNVGNQDLMVFTSGSAVGPTSGNLYIYVKSTIYSLTDLQYAGTNGSAVYYNPTGSTTYPNGYLIFSASAYDTQVGGFSQITSNHANNTSSYTASIGVTRNGNIGIGTTNPVYKLDVSGSSRFGFTSTNTHQFTGSVSLTDGLYAINITASNISSSTISGSHYGTSSWASNSISSSYALNSSNAVSASYALNSSNATSASYALNSSNAVSASFSTNSISASYSISSSYSFNSSNSTSASYSLNSSNATSASYSLNSSNATSASYATIAQTANALNSSNSYTITNLTASNISASGVITSSGLYIMHPSIGIIGSADAAFDLLKTGVNTLNFALEGTSIVIGSGSGYTLIQNTLIAPTISSSANIIGLNITSSNISASGGITSSGINIGGVIYNESIQVDQFDYFQLQPYIEIGNFPSNVLKTSGGTVPTFVAYTGSSAPFSKVAYNTGYYEAIGDFIPVQAGETLYGEIWALRETGATGTAGVLYCGIARYDRNKNALDNNLGLTYFIASAATVPSTSTWTKYSGTTTLPLTHTPFGSSDGGPVRYVRPYIIVDYPNGTVPTYWGAFKIRKTQLTRDTGIVTISGSVGIGTTSPSTNLHIYSTSTATDAIIEANSEPRLQLNTNDGLANFHLFNSYGNIGLINYHGLGGGNYFIYNNSGGGTPANSYTYFQTAGTERMRITGAGRVGIGTSIPSSSLHIRNASSGDQTLLILEHSAGYSVGTENRLDFYDDEAHKIAARIAQYYTGDAGNRWGLKFYTNSSTAINSTPALTLMGNNNVGIGTTSPAYLLDVSGSSRFGWTSSNTHQFTGSVSLTDGLFATNITASNVSASGVITSSGINISNLYTNNIYKKTTGSPIIINAGNDAAKGLQVYYDMDVYNTINFTDSSYNAQSSIYGTSGTMVFRVNGNATTAATINSSGNIGIGTSSPDRKLSVISGSARIASDALSGALYLGKNTDGIYLIRDNSYDLTLAQDEASANGLYLASAGNVYVSIDSNDNDSDKAFIVQNNAIKSGTELFRVSETGNVGIGTNNPIAKLQVNGNISGSSFTSSVSSGVGFLGTSSWAQNVISASYATTASRAISLISSNSYTVDGLTANYVEVTGLATIPTSGIYRPATKTLGLSADGVLIFKISNASSPATSSVETGNFIVSGSVGIGKTNPDYKLHIDAGNTTNQVASFTKTTTSDGKIADFINYNGAGYCSYIYIGSAPGRDWKIGKNVLNSGTVGHFQITDEATRLKMQINGSDDSIIFPSGSVGIGTTSSPNAKLEITGSSNSALLNIKSPISGAILYVSGSGAVGIGDSNVGTYRLYVSGSFGATTKSFIINHPTKEGKKLIYGSLESPYHGIRLTGRDTLVNGKCKIQLPEYMYKLILHDSVNIQLTGIKCNKTLYVDDINIPENYFTIAYDKTMFESYKDYDFFWDFTAIRADVPELITEL